MTLEGREFHVISKSGESLLSVDAFDLKQGELSVVLGPNGSGKTLLLSSLAKVLPYDLKLKTRYDGSIFLNTDRTHYRSVRFVSSRMTALIPDRSAHEVFQLFSWDAPIKIDDSEFDALMRKNWKALSQGQKHRVLLEAAIASKPDFLLLDEILSPMDFYWEWEVFQRLQSLCGSNQMGVLIAHHDLSLIRFGTFSKYHWVESGQIVSFDDYAGLSKKLSARYPSVPYFNKL